MPVKWRLTIDGKPYTDPNIDEGFALVKYVVPSDKNQMLGFSNEKALLDWADKEGKRKIYEDALKGAEKARKEHDRLSDKEIDDYEKRLAAEIKTITAKFEAVLKKEGVASNEAAKILKLAKEGKIGTLYLYQHINFGGRRLPIPNFKWIGRLSSYDFNDITSSVINASPFVAILWQNTWYWGIALPVPPFTAYSFVGWFNDRASSVSW